MGYVLLLVLLRVIPLIWKCAGWVMQTWPTSKVVKEPVQSVTVATKVQNTMESETQNVEKSDVQPFHKHDPTSEY